MLTAAINDETNKSSALIVVIEKANLDEMKKANPITLASVKEGGRMLAQAKYPDNFSLVIAYEEDDRKLYELAKAGDLLGLLGYVRRGYRFDQTVDGRANLVSMGSKEI